MSVFQLFCDLEAGDNQSLKFKWRGGGSNPGPLAPQAKSLTTQQPLLLCCPFRNEIFVFLLHQPAIRKYSVFSFLPSLDKKF